MNNPATNTTDQGDDLTGRTLGDYVLIRRLGRGGMADVYLAEQQSLHRQVAFKVLKSDLAKDESYVKRFVNEARAAAALVQANIVQIYEVGQTKGVHFIAQEFVRGQNLKQYINKYGSTEPILAVNIIRQVALALQKAASEGIIHRDIKPENIMLAPNGEVKVTDFGLARVNNEKQQNELTQIGVTMGTPLYMSPEQVEGGTVDPRTDIYALGITSYHMLAGIPPFDGENALAIAVQHVKNDPEPITDLRPDIPKELGDIINKMISKAPRDRFQDPGELLKELRKIHIDYDDWDKLVDHLASSETVSMMPGQHHTSRMAVTRQLADLMQGKTRAIWSRLEFWLALAAMVLVSCGIGGWMARSNTPEDIFGRVVAKSQTKQDSVEEQYREGLRLNTAFALSAVEKYYPPGDSQKNLLYNRFALERLGELYLRQEEYENADAVYSQLANVPETESRFRMVGLMGQKEIADRRGDADKKNQLELRIQSIRQQLNDDSIYQAVLLNFRDTTNPVF